MPDRVLPEHVQRRLSAALESGTPLTAPLASQARYASLLGGALPAARWRARALIVGVALAGVVAIAFAAPPQPRTWIVQSVGHFAQDVGVPAAGTSPSPEGHKSTEAIESPEPHVTAEPAEPAESPAALVPSSGESGEGGQPQPTPSGDDHGGGGSGDHSPEPSPSNGD